MMAIERHHTETREKADEQSRAQLAQWRDEIELARFATREARELLAKEKDLAGDPDHPSHERSGHEAAENMGCFNSSRI
jgi:hypothetical protein